MAGSTRGPQDRQRQKILALLESGSLQLMAEGVDTEKQLYETLGISSSVWYKLKTEIPEFKELTIRSRQQKFIELKGCLAQQARGYNAEEQCVRRDETGAVIGTSTQTRHIAGNINAAKLLIGNWAQAQRRAGVDDELANWNNNPQEEITVKAEGNVDLAISEEIAKVLKELEKKNA